jgi:tetratricopeptide (TPR) repeat protein
MPNRPIRILGSVALSLALIASAVWSAENASGGPVTQPEASVRADLLVELALANAAARDFESAEQKLGAALQLLPENARALGIRGAVREQLGNDQGALSDYTAAIHLDDKNVTLLLARSAIYARQGLQDSALEDRNRAADLAPRSPEVFVARGNTYCALDQYSRGISDYSMAIALDRTYAPAWSARGRAHLARNRIDEAVADLTQAVLLDPSNKASAEALRDAQSRVNAVVTRQKEIEKAPETVSVQLPDVAPNEPAAEAAAPAPAQKPATPPPTAAALHSRGRELVTQGHYAEAIRQFDEALKLDRNNALIFNARGYAHFLLKKYAEAIADFNQAIAINPAYANAYINRGAAKRASGDAAGGRADLAKGRAFRQE